MRFKKSLTFNNAKPMQIIDAYIAAIPIAHFVGGFSLYLVVCMYLCLNIFTDRLDKEHELKANSSLSWLLIPGPFKYSTFYIRFYKGLSWLMLLILHVVFAALLWSRLR